MQNKWQLFQKFMITEQTNVNLVDFLINALIVLILALILEFTYQRCAKALSNRRIFSANFLKLAFTTMLIITIVKTSLALSLGLVGALSIVRFRAAIKEPEELTYLFFTIAIGLGLGANYRVIVTVAFAILMGIIWIRYYLGRSNNQKQNLFLTVTSSQPQKIQLTDIQNTIKDILPASELKRFDESTGYIETGYLVETGSPEELNQVKNRLKEFSEDIQVTFVDHHAY
ncbi:MAG: DUF4956 domain-containing protein [Bacteroidales bacterium]|nr:DUF4956 domain-containing protein [Bacteroidales bacterium]